jgi:G3E family GTPase
MSSINSPSNLRLALPWLLLICLGIAATELWQDQLSLKKSLASSQQELAKIKVLSLEYQNVGGPTRADQQRFTEAKAAMEWLMKSSKQQGLKTKVSMTELAQQGQSSATAQLKVSFKQAHFNRLIQWVQQQNMTNLTLVVSELKAAGPGKVNGFLRFEIR